MWEFFHHLWIWTKFVALWKNQMVQWLLSGATNNRYCIWQLDLSSWLFSRLIQLSHYVNVNNVCFLWLTVWLTTFIWRWRLRSLFVVYCTLTSTSVTLLHRPSDPLLSSLLIHNSYALVNPSSDLPRSIPPIFSPSVNQITQVSLGEKTNFIRLDSKWRNFPFVPQASTGVRLD